MSEDSCPPTSVLDLIEVQCPLRCGATITPRQTELHVLTVHPEQYDAMNAAVKSISVRHSLVEVISMCVMEGKLSITEALFLMDELNLMDEF